WAAMLAQAEGERKPTAAGARQDVQISVHDWSKAERLLRVLDAAEPDPGSFRRRWRAARTKNDGEALAALSRLPEAKAATSLGTSDLAADLLAANAYAAAQTLLQQRFRRQPHDFWINVGLGATMIVTTPPDLNEAARYFTAALAVRGPNAHGYLLLCQT